jgi:hypothetical protein
MGKMKNEYKILVRKPRGRRPGHRWEDNIRTNLRETGWEGVDWLTTGTCSRLL